jgi:hypothetical protein
LTAERAAQTVRFETASATQYVTVTSDETRVDVAETDFQKEFFLYVENI